MGWAGKRSVQSFGVAPRRKKSAHPRTLKYHSLPTKCRRAMTSLDHIDDATIDDWLDGTLAHDDIPAFDAWLLANPAHAQRVLARSALFQDLGHLCAVKHKQAPIRANQRMHHHVQSARPRTKTALLVAATLVCGLGIILGSASVWEWSTSHQTPSSPSTTIATVTAHSGAISINGEHVTDAAMTANARIALDTDARISLTLQDDTRLRLAGPGTMQLNPDTDTLALINDTGLVEAEVTHRGTGAKPVAIRTNELQAVVMGTQFSVRRSDNSVHVTVTDGAVRVRQDHFKDATLTAGDTLRRARPDQPTSLPQTWDRGIPTAAGIALEPGHEPILVAGFGDATEERSSVATWHPQYTYTNSIPCKRRLPLDRTVVAQHRVW